MGKDTHTTKEIVNLTFQKTTHAFLIVLNDFPMPENGIIGLPFLQNYNINLCNNSLSLDKITHTLETDTIILPENSIQLITIETHRTHGDIIIEDCPYVPEGIFRIRNSQIKVPLCNPTNEPMQICKEEIKYKHIKTLPDRKEVIHVLTIE